MRISERFSALYRALRTKSFYGFQFMRLGEGRLNWKSTDFLKAYETSIYVYACVKKRAEKVGQIEFTLRNSRSGAEIEDDPILNLLYKPNPLQTKNEFFELYQTFKDLTGSAYIYLITVGEGQNRRVAEMWNLRPDWITAVINKTTGLVSAYKYKMPGGVERVFDAADVIASHYPSPLETLKGLSPLKPGALSVDTERQLSEYHNAVLKNGGKVEGIISYKSEYLTEDQIAEIKKSYEKHYADASNAGKPLVLYGGADYQNLGLTPTELSFLESKKLTRGDLLMLYGIPKQLLSQDEGGGLAGDGYDQAKRVFLSETIKPLLDNLITKLDEDRTLVPEPKELGYVDPVPEDVERKIKVAESGLKNGYMTINEVRDDFGLEPVEGGDVPLVSFGLVPLSDVTNPPEDTPADPNAPADPAADPAAQKAKFAGGAHPLKNKEVRDLYKKQALRKIRAREEQGARVARSFFRQQRDRIIKRLEITHPKGLAEDSFDLTAEIDFAKATFLPHFLKWAKAAGEDAMLFSGNDKPFRLSAEIKSTLEKRAGIFAESLNDTTFKRLKREVAASLAEGEPRQKLIKRIEKAYGDISRGRARTIARTEVGVASQTGTMNGYKQSGVGIKVWVTVQDDATRESHSNIDGEERPIDMPFSNGLMYPLDPGGDPEETINCRCSI